MKENEQMTFFDYYLEHFSIGAQYRKEGYTTDYAYKVNGEDGLWIEIRGVKK